MVRERPRRLVPDFAPQVAEPQVANPWQRRLRCRRFCSCRATVMPPKNSPPTFGDRLKKWLPLLPALLLAGAAIWWFAQSSNHRAAPAAPVAAPNEVARPLGLAVEPMGSAWQVSWNPNATALHDAHSVQLFVRAGDDQNRIDLSPHDLSAGIYKYGPAGNDVTFRLEVDRELGTRLRGIVPFCAQRSSARDGGGRGAGAQRPHGQLRQPHLVIGSSPRSFIAHRR